MAAPAVAARPRRLRRSPSAPAPAAQPNHGGSGGRNQTTSPAVALRTGADGGAKPRRLQWSQPDHGVSGGRPAGSSRWHYSSYASMEIDRL
ncbi:hypothetical protein ACP70R_008697 [Stipagrostis hirtigluma subsp. patula]